MEIQPRRSICRQCSERLGRFTTHVLLPTLALLRRADVVSVIGEALMATYQEGRSRRQVAARAGVPLDTVRGWRRRFRERAEEIRVRFTELAHEWDPEQGGIQARASPELDALEAIGVAAAARSSPRSGAAVGAGGRSLWWSAALQHELPTSGPGLTPGPFLPADIRRRRGARSRQEVLTEDRRQAEALFCYSLIRELAERTRLDRALRYRLPSRSRSASV